MPFLLEASSTAPLPDTVIMGVAIWQSVVPSPLRPIAAMVIGLVPSVRQLFVELAL
jgi:hypothetical protein